MIALERAGIPVTEYYASEIDKYAIKISEKNYPQIKRLGDVRTVRGKDLPKIDLLLAGSPCQGFSFAGKQLAFDDPRSALFFEFVRILKETKPKYFLLENVKMKKEYQQVITDTLGVEPIEINSNLITAANRDRLYWTNLSVSPLSPRHNVVKDFAPGFLPMTIGCSKNRHFKITSRFGALTATMYKGIRAAGRPILAKPHCEGVHIDKLKKNIDYRMLTPLECERLQTVPDNYTEGVSNTQRYKMLGNGWTVDVIAHILRHIPDK